MIMYTSTYMTAFNGTGLQMYILRLKGNLKFDLLVYGVRNILTFSEKKLQRNEVYKSVAYLEEKLINKCALTWQVWYQSARVFL